MLEIMTDDAHYRSLLLKGTASHVNGCLQTERTSMPKIDGEIQRWMTPSEKNTGIL